MEEVLTDIGAKLFGGFGPKDGVSEADLAAVEARLKVKLPSKLRRFYRLAGRHPVVSKAHNRFLGPRKLHLHNDGLIFLEQNQRVMFWAVMRADLGLDDPPVQQGNPQEIKWYLDAEFLSAFLLGVVCWQAANGLPWTGQGRVDDRLTAGFEAQLKRADPGGEDKVNDLVGFYEDNLVVCLSRSAKQFLVGAKDDKGLKRFEERFRIEVDWL